MWIVVAGNYFCGPFESAAEAGEFLERWTDALQTPQRMAKLQDPVALELDARFLK